MLQLVCGKEYTFVFEIKIDEKKIKANDEFLFIELVYNDINLKHKFVKRTYMYKYQLTDPKKDKANEEYKRSQVNIFHFRWSSKTKRIRKNQRGQRFVNKYGKLA